MLPPPTLEEKSNWRGSLRTSRLGKLLWFRKHSRMRGFSQSVPIVTLNSGVTVCIRYRCVSPFISYKAGYDSDEPRFPGFGGCCRDRCNRLTKHKDNTFRASGSRTHPVMSDPWSQTEILRKKLSSSCNSIPVTSSPWWGAIYPSMGYSPFHAISKRAYFYDMMPVTVRLVTTVSLELRSTSFFMELRKT
jgi:hypothetical protein